MKPVSLVPTTSLSMFLKASYRATPFVCRTHLRKGRGGQKQAELLELMAKAQADRAKRELEEQLRAKGDLAEKKKVDKVGS